MEIGITYQLTQEDISLQAGFLKDFHHDFSSYFRTQTKTVSGHALGYLQGQLLCEDRVNMSRMSIEVVDFSEQQLSHFISSSPWNDEPLIEAIGQRSVALLSQRGGDLAILLDESGIAKQGCKSVGVQRQYCGSLGKVENCQVGVYLACSNGAEATLIDKRLYLPEVWVNDPARCREAGVPDKAITFKTKAQLGLDMIVKARDRALPFQFVGMDAHYGEQPWLLSELDQNGIEYMADIPCDTRVYLDYPTVGIPKKQGNRGPNPSKKRVLCGQAREVRDIVNDPSIIWQTLKLRDTQRGELWVTCAALRVYRIEDELPVEQPVWLVIRKELDDSDIKFSFSNANKNTMSDVLFKRQSYRYWVERALEDGKGLAGLDQYQVIGWRGWHHHMAMVLLAMLFLLTLKCNLKSKAPMMTLQDAYDILKIVMPKKKLTYGDAVKIIEKKHQNRFRSRQSRLMKQKQQLKSLKIEM